MRLTPGTKLNQIYISPWPIEKLKVDDVISLLNYVPFTRTSQWIKQRIKQWKTLTWKWWMMKTPLTEYLEGASITFYYCFADILDFTLQSKEIVTSSNVYYFIVIFIVIVQSVLLLRCLVSTYVHCDSWRTSVDIFACLCYFDLWFRLVPFIILLEL